jgi:hypothetical protein
MKRSNKRRFFNCYMIFFVINYLFAYKSAFKIAMDIVMVFSTFNIKIKFD